MMVCLVPRRSIRPCAQAASSSPLMRPLRSASAPAAPMQAAQASVARLPFCVANETCVSLLAAMYKTCGPRASLAMAPRLRAILVVLVGSPQA